ncbi:MAG TPA: peptide-methionine (S)-S-oxide reductase MsrA [Caulobacteraceae bacterium]|jgi:peptide-methionine (S)-S-oxide reductase
MAFNFSRQTLRRALLTTLAAASLVACGAPGASADVAPPSKLPAPTMDEPQVGLQTAVLSGGCFWGIQGVFEHVKGVKQVLAGYAGGDGMTAHYEIVSTGTTGHAESVKITFDPKQISYGEILRVFFSVGTDPTQTGGQFPDEGTQYRGEVWAMDNGQAAVAKRYIDQLNAAHVFRHPITTRIDRYRGFFPAEGYHQNYLVNHPEQPYIATYDLPKVAALKTLFPEDYRPDPVLAPI